MEPREAARRISRAWLAYRDRQIFRILASVLSVTNEGQDGALLARLSPNEAALFDLGIVILKVEENIHLWTFLFFKAYSFYNKSNSV